MFNQFNLKCIYLLFEGISQIYPLETAVSARCDTEPVVWQPTADQITNHCSYNSPGNNIA